MEFDIVKEMNVIRSMLIKISEHQDANDPSNGLDSGFQARFEARIDNLESQIAAIRLDSGKILKLIEGLLPIKENLDESTGNDKKLNLNGMNGHGRNNATNPHPDVSVNTENHNNLSKQRGPSGNHAKPNGFRKAAKSGNYTLRADLVLDSPSVYCDHSHAISPCGPAGKDATDDERQADVKADLSYRANDESTPNVNRFKTMRDSVEHTKPEGTVDSDSDSDDDAAKSRCTSVVLCGRALLRCRWRTLLRHLLGISKPDIFANDPGSRAIHPNSPFMAGPFCKSSLDVASPGRTGCAQCLGKCRSVGLARIGSTKWAAIGPMARPALETQIPLAAAPRAARSTGSFPESSGQSQVVGLGPLELGRANLTRATVKRSPATCRAGPGSASRL